MKLKAWAMILAYVFVYLVLPAIFYVMTSNLTSLTQVQLGGMVLLCILAVWLYHKKIRDDYHLLLTQRSFSKFSVELLFAFFGVMILRALLITIFSPWIDFETLGANQQAIQDLAQSVPLYHSFFMIVIFAPLVEELVFREAIIGPYDQNKRPLMIFLTLLSVFLFTAAHMMTLADALLYLPLTIVLTYFYWKYDRNVVASMAFHLLNNFLGWIMTLLVQNMNF